MTAGTVADALEQFRQGCAAIAAVDRTVCTPDELARLVVGVGRMSDRLRAVHALHMVDADRVRVWSPSGARNVTDWYAQQTAVGRGDAIRLVKLADVLERSDRILTAVLAGRLSAAAAEGLHTAIVQGPAGADIDAFLDEYFGTRLTPDQPADPAPADGHSDPTGSDDHGDAEDAGDGAGGGDGGPAADPGSEPDPGSRSGFGSGGFGFGPEPEPDSRQARPAGPGPKDTRDAANDWKQRHADPDNEAERLRARRSVTSGFPDNGLATTTVVLPVLETRIVLNALDHIAGTPADSDERSLAQRRADALVALCDAYAKGAVTGGREHPKIIVTIDLDSYLGRDNRPGVTSMGDRIPAAVVRELAEQAELRWMLHTGLEILQLGRTHRLASDAQWEALVARDGCCRWPGCTIPAAWCEVDHVVDWDHGGLTDIDEEALWCGHHHHVKHRPGTIVLGNALNLRLQLPDGTIIDCPPKGNIGRSSRQPKPDPASGATATTEPDPQPGQPGQTGQPGQAGLFDAA